MNLSYFNSVNAAFSVAETLGKGRSNPDVVLNKAAACLTRSLESRENVNVRDCRALQERIEAYAQNEDLTQQVAALVLEPKVAEAPVLPYA